ncbi:MAG: HepT-like ribonuclease domain-containing protein [Terriglobales bacterium]
MLRSAVERQLEIAGEALAQLARTDLATAELISEYRRVAFRNLLIHGYAEIDDRIVWSVLETKLPVLHRETESLLASAEEESQP